MQRYPSSSAHCLAPLVLPWRRGRARFRFGCTLLPVCLGVSMLAGGWGLALGLLFLSTLGLLRAPRHGVLVFAGSPRLLWQDSSFVVLAAPWRIVFRDELHPAHLAWLCRRARGLSE